ncbi:MAG TPA: S-methyl-5-thioribose-1-phosphate isomerase [Thermodesulfobacteriota bacterium]
MVTAIEWTGERLRLLDQTRLPAETRWVEARTADEVADAIRTMVVRGAPAIGVAAAFGVALWARGLAGAGAPRLDAAAFVAAFEPVRARLAATRPTAVNLFWALDRMARVVREAAPLAPGGRADRLAAEARAILDEDLEANRRMGRLGAELIPDGARILTHCNAGALATAGYGTALGVIRAAREAGKRIEVLADETRPFLQGARLTTWELREDGIPVTLVTDNMAGHLMQRRRVDLVIVGADRIAANGDVANKIGTYGLAVLAKEHGLPFYVAAPVSTFDLSLVSGEEIPIEERDPREVTTLAGRAIAPEGVPALHPAFDVTPARLVTAIITEAGIARPPTRERLRELAASAGTTAA